MMTENNMSGASPAPKPDFSEEAMQRLFFWARDRVTAVVAGGRAPDANALGEIGAQSVLGAFVSFKKHGRLRSCMGYMNEGTLLSTALDSAAVSAACRDPRFPPINPGEFYDLDMEVWALGSMREIDAVGEARRDAFKIGRDGLQIQGRGRRGLLLPSVPVELGWNVDQFLDGLCDKAGLARGAWMSEDTKLFAFEGVSFKKPFVWHAGRNPALDRLVKQRQESADGQETTTSRPTFSFVPGVFDLRAPARRQDVPTPDYAAQTRPAAVAGMFYPRSSGEQKSALDAIMAGLPAQTERRDVPGAMVPHAGWIYSARLAAETMSRIKEQETIVVLAPKHRHEGANLAVMPCGFWDYGGGKTENNLEFVDEFVKALPEFRKDLLAHRSEHSIEVQLPLLARFFPNARVVGVLIGRASQSELDSMAVRFASMLDAWEASGKKRPLLLVSSDMNHYADDDSTRVIDKTATDALETTDPVRLLTTVVNNRISMCGILPAYLALTTLRRRGGFSKALRVGYATSAEASEDKERVVGYAGYLFE